MSGKYKVCAIIVAGGEGKRLGGAIPKQYLPIGNEMVLEKTIKAFYNNKLIDKVCVVISEGHLELFKPIAEKFENMIYCYGGVLRQDSVKNGLDKLKEYKPDLVLIHDGARPFVSNSIINNVISELENNDVVLPAIKLRDTIKMSDGEFVEKTLDRSQLFAAQTPQGFKYKLICELHEEAGGTELTDDVSLAEQAGKRVKIVEGDSDNFKITTVNDLKIAGYMNQKMVRVGNGFDVHQFEDGNEIILCGIKIPHNKKLKGHSDADCAWHALTDALLGSVGLGDIGEHFPDSDAKWSGADSAIFLKKAADEIAKRNGEISNVDMTIICEEPKMKDHKAAMRCRTAEILNIDEGRINIKATTTEKLGSLGRKEGLAVFATATVYI